MCGTNMDEDEVCDHSHKIIIIFFFHSVDFNEIVLYRPLTVLNT